MEAIITVVGFLGSGKTTLLRHLINNYVNKGYNPFVVLNDYENANLEAQQFLDQLDSNNSIISPFLANNPAKIFLFSSGCLNKVHKILFFECSRSLCWFD